MTDLADHALEMARIAGEVAMEHFRRPLDIDFKADESPVTQADRAVEGAVRAYLAEHFPGHGIYGEEEGASEDLSGPLWVVDPIDGTRSFLSGHPLFGFLLAHLVDGKAHLGVVGMPALGEFYLGVAGEGAWCDGERVSVSKATLLDRAILYVNEIEHIHNREPEVFRTLLSAGQTRRFAYDCYPHALLAAGRVDAVVDFNLEPYDYLAVGTLVEAAGGVVTDWEGQPLTLQSDGRVVSAATPELHAELLARVQGAG